MSAQELVHKGTDSERFFSEDSRTAASAGVERLHCYHGCDGLSEEDSKGDR